MADKIVRLNDSFVKNFDIILKYLCAAFLFASVKKKGQHG